MDKKWGYKLGDQILISPMYDTAFPFDKTNSIALVGIKKNNSLEKFKSEFNYYYINASNIPVKVKSTKLIDSVSVLPAQYPYDQSYQDSVSYFKILFQSQIYLFSKNGKQLSTGYDTMYCSPLPVFLMTELYTKMNHYVFRSKGLIDTAGRVIIKCQYKRIGFNEEDSVMYCCSAVFSDKQNDDVFDYKGNLIYSNKNHIQFSYKSIHVHKLYESTPSFMIYNEQTKNTYTITGDEFYNLGHHKACIIQKEDLIFLNLLTEKKQKLSKTFFMKTFNFMYN